MDETLTKQQIFKDYIQEITSIVNNRTNLLENQEHYNEMLDNLLIELEKNNQLIIYGTAGLGKSHSIKNLINKKEISNNYTTFRTVFHPEFSYYDFVGKLLPITKEDKSITYEFQDGIFTKAYKKAIENKNENVYLIIDEINRGYTTGIFGDIFLLLDRENNQSSYEIQWTGLQGKTIDNKSLKLPKNLYIIGTMNTSDKTTIKLDKAFERRFNKYFISLQDSIENYSEYTYLEENHGTTWKSFLSNLNNKIKKDLFSNVEDIDNELIGPYFIKSTKYIEIDENNINNIFPNLDNGKYNGAIDSFNGVEFTEEEYQDLKEMILNHSIINKSDIQYSLMYHLWYSTYSENRKQLTNSISFEDFITMGYNDFIESIINYNK